MRHYEIVFLVHPDQSEQVPAMIDRYKSMVADTNGQVHRIEDWGRRRLAYIIGDVHKAHYVMMNIECDLALLKEIERNFKFNDSILRHLVVRRKSAITEESAMAKAKAQEEAEEAEKSIRSKSRQTAEEETSQDSEEESNKEEDSDGVVEAEQPTEQQEEDNGTV